MRNNKWTNNETGRIVAGLILVAVGGVLLLRKMGFYFPGWLVSWPMVLILVGIYLGVKHNFRNNAWIIMIAIGGFFLLNQVIPGWGLKPYFWPIAIILAGVFFIFRPKEGFMNHEKWNADLPVEDIDPNNPSAPTSSYSIIEDTDYIKLDSVFSGVNRRVLSKNFRGGHLSSVFGGAEVDFSQAEITSPVVLKMEVVFGGIKLIVPSHWAIQNELDGVFHGVEDKRRIAVMPDLNPTKVLVLKGSVVFGGVEIKNPKL